MRAFRDYKDRKGAKSRFPRHFAIPPWNQLIGSKGRAFSGPLFQKADFVERFSFPSYDIIELTN
jgi:hypothetical protein